MAEYEADLATYETAMKQLSDKLASIAGPNRRGAVLIDGPLVMGEDLRAIDFANKGKNNWIIVNGDLVLSGKTAAQSSSSKQDASQGSLAQDSPDSPDGPASRLLLRGNILVTGNVSISGDVDVDATLFTLGRTEIRDAAIRGLRSGPRGGKKELVLIGAGSIDLYRVDSFQSVEGGYSSPQSSSYDQVLDAFFYTDGQAELYGVGSAFWMNGGFFSKGDMTLNADAGHDDRELGERQSRLREPDVGHWQGQSPVHY